MLYCCEAALVLQISHLYLREIKVYLKRPFTPTDLRSFEYHIPDLRCPSTLPSPGSSAFEVWPGDSDLGNPLTKRQFLWSKAGCSGFESPSLPPKNPLLISLSQLGWLRRTRQRSKQRRRSGNRKSNHLRACLLLTDASSSPPSPNPPPTTSAKKSEDAGP